MEQIWTSLLAFSADQRIHWKVSLMHQIMQHVSFAYVALILLSGRMWQNTVSTPLDHFKLSVVVGASVPLDN